MSGSGPNVSAQHLSQKDEVRNGLPANRTCLASMPVYEDKCRPYRDMGIAANYSGAAYDTAMALEDRLKTRVAEWKDLMHDILELPKEDRNLLSFRTHTIAVYGGPEVDDLRNAERDAVLRAAPSMMYDKLNVADVGAGGQLTNPSFISIDLVRGHGDEAWRKKIGQHTTANTILAWADDLPFARNSLDAIVSRHNLEHIADPVNALLHYLDIVKPGGGIGIVVPDWRFAWDATKDAGFWGHKWNTEPETLCKLYHACLSSRCTLEQLRTYRDKGFALSFDFVLRKFGTWKPFLAADPEDARAKSKMKTGKEQADASLFI